MAIAARDLRELRLDAMSRSFGSVKALKGVTLNVRRGEFIALLGPSGCGKSTALNCLAGLLTLSGGSIWLDSTRIDRLKPEERGFGMMFQNYALFPHMSVKRNIGFGLSMQGCAKADIEKRINEALSIVRLGDQGEKLPGQLSGGQQQRVAIARAIVIEPPLVLMDEPLSNLDAKLRLEMRAEIRRIHDLIGSATIYVTHDQEEALSLADSIVVMRDGLVRQVGAPEELYVRPAHADVAEFMGYRNLIRSRASSSGNVLNLRHLVEPIFTGFLGTRSSNFVRSALSNSLRNSSASLPGSGLPSTVNVYDLPFFSIVTVLPEYDRGFNSPLESLFSSVS